MKKKKKIGVGFKRNFSITAELEMRERCQSRGTNPKDKAVQTKSVIVRVDGKMPQRRGKIGDDSEYLRKIGPFRLDRECVQRMATRGREGPKERRRRN